MDDEESEARFYSARATTSVKRKEFQARRGEMRQWRRLLGSDGLPTRFVGFG